MTMYYFTNATLRTVSNLTGSEVSEEAYNLIDKRGVADIVVNYKGGTRWALLSFNGEYFERKEVDETFFKKFANKFA